MVADYSPVAEIQSSHTHEDGGKIFDIGVSLCVGLAQLTKKLESNKSPHNSTLYFCLV